MPQHEQTGAIVPLRDYNKVEFDDASRVAAELLDRLGAAQRSVLRVLYGIGGPRYDEPEAAEVLGMSVARLRRTHAAAIEALRSDPEAFDAYLSAVRGRAG